MDLANTFGAILLGTFFAAILYGITILQTFIYIQNSKKDPLWSKLVVCYLWVLDTLHISFAIHVVYYYLILNYFDPLQLLDVAWSYKAQNIVGPICISSVQTLYVLRVWKLDAVVHRQSRFRYLLPVIVTILLFGGYAGSIAFWYELVQPANDSILHLEGLKWVTYVPLSLWSGVDVTIALSMSYLLARSRTGFQRSNTVIATIMMFTLNTGAITSVLSITSIIAKAALPGELVFIGLQSPLVPLHTNSFMAMYNARRYLRSRQTMQSRPGDFVLNHMNSFPSSGVHENKSVTFSSNESRHCENTGGGLRTPIDVAFTRSIVVHYSDNEPLHSPAAETDVSTLA